MKVYAVVGFNISTGVGWGNETDIQFSNSHIMYRAI